jgi:hypothetical protein
MHFRLQGDWPVGQWCVPAGTFIDGNDPKWNGIALPLPMPMNAIALDQEAADVLADWYPHHLHRLHCADGIVPKRSTHV